MNHLPTGLAIATLLTGAMLLSVVPGIATATGTTSGPGPVLFGMESASMAAQANAGVKADYGTFWIGPWTLSSGWGGPDAQLDQMKAAGVTPAIHFYYWGDDISPSCVENGCWSSLHNAQKDRAHWDLLATQLTDHLNNKMQGRPALIFLESEFNKGGIETYEPFDGYMAAMADKLHAGYPASEVVLGFGNWGSQYWHNFDRAAAASDMVGIQGMRGSTHQSQADMMTLYDGLLTGVKTLETTFPGEPIMLTDIAVSSYPEPDYLAVQHDVLKEVFDNLGVLKSHGVRAIVYRSWYDSPNMDTANYYGMAERYWGLANANQAKPSAQVWIDGVKAERAGSGSGSSTTTTTSASTTTTASSTTTSTAAFAATFATVSSSNEYWVQETVNGNRAAAKVDVQVNGGAFQALKHESYGDWTLSTHIAKGTQVKFRATASDGQTATSASQPWLGAASSTTTTTAASTTSTAAFAATFSTDPASNEYWVQETVNGNRAAAKVDVQVNGGAWQALQHESYGDWTLSTHIAKGTQVVFRATAADGQTSKSPAHAWLGAASTTTTTTAPAFKATFTPKGAGNDWWVETAVSANAPIAKVEAKVNSGSYVVLAKQDWGTYAASIHAPNGSLVTFRATSSTGAVSTSAATTWT